MTNVLSLDDYRAETRGKEPLVCECGSQWFALDGRSAWAEYAPHGALTLSEDGRVTGRLGEVVCVECRRVQRL